MSPRRLSLCIAALALCACSEQAIPPTVRITAPSGLGVAGRRLFVANTDQDQLRALALDRTPRQFLRAPNPIAPLAIPTARWPSRVAAAPVDGTGQALSPFVFALSTPASRVSVLSLDGLNHLGDLGVPEAALSVAVPSVAPGDPTRLVVGVAQVELGALYVVELPASFADDPAAIGSAQPRMVASLGRSRPQALAASPVAGNLLAVGDRLTGDDGLGRSGALALVDLSTGVVERFDVGGPVVSLSFAPTGAKLFGAFDAEACGARPSCFGAFAFDVERRSLAGTVEIPGGVWAIAAGVDDVLTMPPDGTSTVEVHPAVLVASATGALYVLDGGAMRVVDTDSNGPQVLERVHLGPDGAPSDDGNGPADPIELAEGAMRTERIGVTYEGALPGLRGRNGVLAGGAVSEDGVDFASFGVRGGDLVVLDGIGSSPLEATVAAAAVGRLSLAAPGASCPEAAASCAVRYTVRVRGAYAVAGSLTGFLGRASAGERFVFAGSYFHRPDGYDPSAPALAFAMGPGDPRRDARYELSLSSGIAPFSVPMTTFGIPSDVVCDPILGVCWTAYLGGNSLVELTPPALRHGNATAGIVLFQ